MLLPIFAASAALLSLTGLVNATPQFAAASSTVSSSTALSTATVSGTTACNNSPLLCSRSYSNITHLGAHDIAFLRDSTTSFSTAGNQFFNATVALSAGIRLLQAQVHNLNGTLELCHTSCSLLDGGSLEAWLGDIKGWMDANPTEVVTLLLVNSDNLAAEEYGAAYTTSGISTYGFTPSTTSGPLATWPALGTMIAANTRLVSFIASITYDANYPYLLPEFSFVFETAFGVSSLGGFNCSLDRPSTVSSASAAISSGYLPLLNHFADTSEAFGISIPDITDIETTNSNSTTTTGSLGAHGSQCATEYGQKPTFILVDFWNVGPAISTADILNGVTDVVGRTAVSVKQLVEGSSNKGTKMGGMKWGIAGVAIAVVAAGNFVWL